MLYTIWSNISRTEITPVPGDRPLRFADGTPDPACEVVLHRFEAGSEEEAMETYRRLMGWGPGGEMEGIDPIAGDRPAR